MVEDGFEVIAMVPPNVLVLVSTNVSGPINEIGEHVLEVKIESGEGGSKPMSLLSTRVLGAILLEVGKLQ